MTTVGRATLRHVTQRKLTSSLRVIGGLCPALVVERLKARGLSLEAIQEICKP